MSSNNLEKYIYYICKKEYKYFLHMKNVVGVGLGYKIKNGFLTDKKCIKVFVTKKFSKDNLCCNDLVPMFYKGIETDVFESGVFTMNSLTNKIRPVPCGYDIGPILTDSSGTLGCVVTDNDGYYILSNNHVIACENSLRIGTDILQPSPLFLKESKENTIANLSSFVPIYPKTKDYEPVNIVDCAIAKVSSRSQVLSDIAILGKIKSAASAKLKQQVQKVGSQTELTKGTITEIGATILINDDTQSYIFTNQIITTKMSESGDSGALLLDTKKNILGLIMGATDSTTVSNSISHVLKSLDIKIVN